MSILTLEDAISHATEVAERYEEEYSHDDKLKAECLQCAADHRQLAKWLTELKELRILVAGDNTLSIQKLETILAIIRAQNNDNDIDWCELCEKTVKLQDSVVKLKEAKRLLKLAVEDIANPCNNDAYTPNSCNACINKGNCNYSDSFKWRYADKALALIGDERNEQRKKRSCKEVLLENRRRNRCVLPRHGGISKG